MPTDTPLSRVIEQRVRNQIIEYVQMVAHYKAGEMPGLTEVICMWEDYVLHPLNSQQQFQMPVYTPVEKAALEKVDKAWADFSDSVTGEMIDNNEPAALAKPQWSSLVTAAIKAAGVLAERGKLPEE